MFNLIASLILAAQAANPPDAILFERLLQQQRTALRSARYAEAERLCREAELIARRLPDPDRHLTLIANETAVALSWQARYAEAAVLLEETLPAAMKVSAERHLTTVVNLSATYRALGKLPEAQLILNRVLRADGAAGLPEALAARAQLAGIEAALGRPKAAGALYSEVLTEQTRRLGQANRETIMTLASFIGFLIDSKRYAEAEPLARRYLEDNAEVELAGHPSHAFGHYFLATIATNRKRYAQARQSLDRALVIFEASVGRRHPDVAAVLDMLADVELKSNHPDAALELSREAVSIGEETFGPRHGETGRLLSTYADILDRLKRHDQARQARALATAIAKESASAASRAARRIDWQTFRREAGR